jgi:hypothetical protein
LTDRFSHDDQQVNGLLTQIDNSIDHFSADGAYDETPVYNAVTEHSPNASVVIPPRSTAVESDKSAPQRKILLKLKQWVECNGSEKRSTVDEITPNLAFNDTKKPLVTRCMRVSFHVKNKKP